MKHRLHSRFQPGRRHRLSHPIADGGDGGFIPLLLLARLGMCDVVLALPSE